MPQDSIIDVAAAAAVRDRGAVVADLDDIAEDTAVRAAAVVVGTAADLAVAHRVLDAVAFPR